MTPDISIIIPSKNEGEMLDYTITNAIKNSADHNFEIIVIDDGSTDGSGFSCKAKFSNEKRVSVIRTAGLGEPHARLLGADLARGSIMIQIDSHTYCSPGWISPLIEPFQEPDVAITQSAIKSLGKNEAQDGAVGMNIADYSMQGKWLPLDSKKDPHEIPIAAFGSHAISRHVYNTIGGYDPGMLGAWGGSQEEISIRAWRMGYRVIGVPESVVFHQYRNKENPTPYEMPWNTHNHNFLRVALLHFGYEVFVKVMDHYKNTPGFAESVALLLQSDVLTRKEELEDSRVKDGSWYIEKFGCAI